jgi:UDP-glucose:(heptosyl)LPS alpha-1,3-glucosyltransferase
VRLFTVKVALVHIRHAGTGGTERYLDLVARHLAERGHEVTIVCRTHERAPHPSVRFRVLRRHVPGRAWQMWAFAQDVERHVRQSDHDVVFGLGRTWTHDVVRLGGGLHATWLELERRDSRRARLFGPKLKDVLTVRIEERALAPGAYVKVVANSAMVERDVTARMGVPAEAIEVVHNGVDVERFRPELRASEGQRVRAEAGLAEGERALLFLGSGFARKGLDRLLAAFALLAPDRPTWRLVVVGYDRAPAVWRVRAQALGIADKVRFLGGRRDAEACYAAADLYCLPTRYDPFANSTVEALASGLPVLTTDTNGGAEVIRTGESGEVLPGDADAERLRAALFEWTRPGRAEAARGAAREVALANTAERMVARSAEILESVARGAPR